MQASRLSLAMDRGLFSAPAGAVAVFRPTKATDLSALPKQNVRVIQGFRPDYDWFAAQGYDVAIEADKACEAAVICVPRHKLEARARIAKAAEVVVPGGAIVVDGQKNDGVESLIKELRRKVEIGDVFAKAHGKLVVFQNPGPEVFQDWAEGPAQRLPEGFVTRPAAFSADGVDPGSQALAAVLPPQMQGNVADFGAGWGYLSSEVLTREGVKQVHLIEAEHAALDAARQNLSDPRAQFHWADATRFDPPVAFDAVVMNPPFHTGRNADPNLGRAFIAAAKRALGPSGVLWMVANRHLPYEQALNDAFRDVENLESPASYKLYRASAPRSESRKRR